MGLRDFTLHDVVARNARLYPQRTAFVADGRRITHAEYLARVERLATGLAAAGIAPGERIAVLAQNSLEFVDLYGAAARLGAILVPINWRLSADEIAHVITDTMPKAIVADAEYQAGIAAARERFAFTQSYYAIGDHVAPFVPFAGLYAPGAVAPAADIEADSGYVIIHTAAVGGEARGALLSHRNLLAANLQSLHCLGLQSEDVNLGALPLFHIAGSGLMLAVQHAGGATVVMKRFDAQAAARHVESDRVTLFGEFAPMLGTLLDKAGEGRNDLSSLRSVTGLDSPETMARFEKACPNARFWVGFGQSETSGFVSLAPYRENPGSAGRPAALNTGAGVDDPDVPRPPGGTGEIVVRGPVVFKGYWTLEADNAFTFRNGWHHTGDMGRFDDKGYLWYAGRSPAKELIKPGGENVYPAEVEKLILEHPAILEVSVLGVPDAQWGEAVKAVCVCKPGQQVSAAELIEFVGGRIARYKKPKHVVFVEGLPKTAAGAVDRARTKELYGSA